MEKYKNPELSIEERAACLADRMTTEEQASMLRYDSPAIERLSIPAYNWWNEGLHGVARAGTATVFPQAIGLAAAFDEELIEKVANVISNEARAKYNAQKEFDDRDIYKGLTLWSPNINIFRDPRWGRGHETYGEDPYLTATLGCKYVKGLQGEGKVLRTAACAKHLAVHSGPEKLRHEFNAEVSCKDMEETYLYAFGELIEKARVESVMGAYNRVNGEPACANSYLMKRLSDWGFDGYFVSDCWAINDFHANHKVTKTPPQSAAMALKAGCHLNCGNTYQQLLVALEEGLITKEDIRKACIRVLKTRFKLGMFDPHTEYDDIPWEYNDCDENDSLSLSAAEETMVLLENNGILPLDQSKINTIAVIGPNADSIPALEGNYNGISSRYVTFLQGIKNATDKRVIYAEGCHLYKDRVSGLAKSGDRYAEAMAAAKISDVVILVLGLDATIEGEEGDAGNEFSSGDKQDLRLPPPQRELLQRIVAIGKPVITVVAAGSAINTEIKTDALIHVWYPGQRGGTALANILFGKVSPCGKLPVTFYKDSDRLPDFTDYGMKGRTYRYCEDYDNILYPFGYGLGYIKTEVTDLSYNNGKACVTIKNTGDREGKEVVQLYIKRHCENDPLFTLVGFKKVFLKAGGSITLEFTLSDYAFLSVNEKGERVKSAESYTLYAGTHQPDKVSDRLLGKSLSIEIR